LNKEFFFIPLLIIFWSWIVWFVVTTIRRYKTAKLLFADGCRKAIPRFGFALAAAVSYFVLSTCEHGRCADGHSRCPSTRNLLAIKPSSMASALQVISCQLMAKR
jgi:hypothetical protein